MSRKIRIYPPVIVTALVALIFAVMAISSIVAEAEREAAGQQAPPLITLAQPTETPWPTAEPQPTPIQRSFFSRAHLMKSREGRG